MSDPYYSNYHAFATEQSNPPKKYSPEYHVLQMCERNDIIMLQVLLENPSLAVDIHYQDDLFLRKAIEHGSLQIVEYLLTSKELKENANINTYGNSALALACMKGHLDIVEFMLTSPKLGGKTPEIGANDNIALRSAMKSDEVEVVKFLLTSPKMKVHADLYKDRSPLIYLAYLQRKEAPKVCDYLYHHYPLEETPEIKNLISRGTDPVFNEFWQKSKEQRENSSSLNHDAKVKRRI